MAAPGSMTGQMGNSVFAVGEVARQHLLALQGEDEADEQRRGPDGRHDVGERAHGKMQLGPWPNSLGAPTMARCCRLPCDQRRSRTMRSRRRGGMPS